MKPLPFFAVFIFLFIALIILLTLPGRGHLVREALRGLLSAGGPGRADLAPVTASLSITPSLSVSASLSVTDTGRLPAEMLATAPQAVIAADEAAAPRLADFAAGLVNGRAADVVGVYAPGLFALRVDQQPAGHPEYVNRQENLVTEFSLPRKYGSTGLLAHNYLSGSHFFALDRRQDVYLVYGDGRKEHYVIDQVQKYRALKPNSPFSDFVDLADPDGAVLTSADLFSRVYTFDDTLVFQTCIDAEGDPSWGRMFVLARRVEAVRLYLSGPVFQTSDN